MKYLYLSLSQDSRSASEAATLTMSGPSSPATRFHDVEVANDQTGAQWHAPVAFIRGGLIVVTGRPPRGFFDLNASTFTITAADAGGRQRRFPLVILDRGASGEGEFVFG